MTTKLQEHSLESTQPRIQKSTPPEKEKAASRGGAEAAEKEGKAADAIQKVMHRPVRGRAT